MPTGTTLTAIDPQVCAMKLVDGDHTEQHGAELRHYEVWECECGNTYLYNCDWMHEQMRVEFHCTCGKAYLFDAEKHGIGVYPQLIKEA